MTLLTTFVIVTSCRGQAIMRTLSDAPKLKANAKNYVGMPLSKLLNDIGTPILWVSTKEGNSSSESPSYFYFRFNYVKDADSLQKLGQQPVGIVAYIKEPFVWDHQSRPADKKFSWTLQDAKRYGNLTIERLRVFTDKHDE